MIKSIEFSSKAKTNPFGYETTLPALKGKKFEFKPGLNVIVGTNGCGKTSLLNVIRYLTFCNGSFSSDISRGHSEWQMHRSHVFERGYWRDVVLKADYKMAVWNLRKNGDFESHDFSSSVENFQQRMSKKSDGQNIKQAFSMMMGYMFYGYEDPFKKDIEKGKESRSFKKRCLDPLDKMCNRTEKNDKNAKSDCWHVMRKYYEDNRVEEKGITILMDEPDKGLDIDNVKDLLEFITKDHVNNRDKGGQIICVLHNIGMIHKLKSVEGVNFIELSDGYVDKVERFFG